MSKSKNTVSQPKNAEERKAVVPVTAQEMAVNANKVGSLSVADDLAKKLSGCQITQSEWQKYATGIMVEINGVKYVADVKDFKSGKVGWYLNAGSVPMKLEEPTVRADWETSAKYITVKLNGNDAQPLTAWPKAFKVKEGAEFGSVGWNISDKALIAVQVGTETKVARVQVGFNLTVNKSKEKNDEYQFKGLVPCQLGLSLVIVKSDEME